MRVDWHGQSAFTLDGESATGLHRPLVRSLAGTPESPVGGGFTIDGATAAPSRW